jgi:hypothetical protein
MTTINKPALTLILFLRERRSSGTFADQTDKFGWIGKLTA